MYQAISQFSPLIVLVSIEKIYQTLQTVFHLKGCQNYSPVRRFCQVFSRCLWNYGKTRSLVFYMLHGISFPSFNGITQQGTCLGEVKLVRDCMCQLLEKKSSFV